MKILVTPQYYADNRIELNNLVKDTNDIIICKNNNTESCLIPDYMLVLNEQLKGQLKDLYYKKDLIPTLNSKKL